MYKNQFVDEWKKKKADSPAGIKYKQRKDEVVPPIKMLNGDTSDPQYQYFAEPDVEEGNQFIETYRATISKATGALNEKLGIQFIKQAREATPFGREFSSIAEAVSASLLEMEPADPIEGMIITQLVAIHNQLMEFMKRAIEKDAFYHEIDTNINRYAKLNIRFLNTLELLIKYRKRGDQTLNVENLTINQDGKAIIGNFQNSDQNTEKKSR